MPDYANPPVHEVVVSLAFDAARADARTFVARAKAESWPVHLAHPVSLDDTMLMGRASPGGGEPTWQARVTSTGLAFSDRPQERATRALQLRPELASYHVIRSSPWPEGEYVGWDAIAAQLRELRPAFERMYSGTRISRLALRYLNRIAAPSEASLDRWLAVGVYGPPGVSAPAGFSVHLQWEELGHAPEFGASLGLYPISVDDPERRGGDIGLQLDLEVARYDDGGSMRWDTIEEWLARAHDAHHMLFESCITDALRDRFRTPPLATDTPEGGS